MLRLWEAQVQQEAAGGSGLAGAAHRGASVSREDSEEFFIFFGILPTDVLSNAAKFII
ncbi:hypothetical protein D3C81_625700 [compost metagenome]